MAENGFESPRRFFSRSAHVRALAERGKEIRAKWAGPNDKVLTRWDAVSPDQLDKARELVSRPRERTGDNGVVTSVRELDETFRVERER